MCSDYLITGSEVRPKRSLYEVSIGLQCVKITCNHYLMTYQLQSIVNKVIKSKTVTA